MIQYTINPVRFEINPSSQLTDVVYNVFFELTGTDGDNVHTLNLSVIHLSEPNEADFVPFSELTKEVVVGWINAQMPTEKMNDYKQYIAEQIAIQQNIGAIRRDPPWI